MLKHHSRRLARRLSTLFMLVAVLTALASSPVDRKAIATTQSSQAASSATAGLRCWFKTGPSGECVMVCCGLAGCTENPCP
jgi:hypothetical protein